MSESGTQTNWFKEFDYNLDPYMNENRVEFPVFINKRNDSFK